MRTVFPTDAFRQLTTPFYYYDTDLLRATIRTIQEEVSKHAGFCVHYAIKANANPRVLNIIGQAGLGADCVSGGEILAALNAGIPKHRIVYAGVGKSDWEINLGLDKNIFCFNVESIAELEVLNELAAHKEKTARVALRINPDVKAHTHAKITTGMAENKFGIALCDMDDAVRACISMEHIDLVGLHFHIGSQILRMDDFAALCNRVNDLQRHLEQSKVKIEHINVGGGLGIEYNYPDELPIPDFKSYFATYARHLELREGQTLHFELGRSIVGQCGSLITRVLYVKQGVAKQFAIVDGSMTELIRPALYQAYHQIENLQEEGDLETYDVVGPVCESSDVFAKAVDLRHVKRGDLLAIRSAGAYGESMASCYNCRKLPSSYLTEDL